MDEAIVCAGPQHSLLLRRFRERENRVVILDRGDVVGERPAARLLFAFVVPRQVFADCFPTVALVGRLEDAFRGGVNHIGIMRRNQQRRDPLEAVREIDRAVAGIVERENARIVRVLFVLIVNRQVTFVVGINHVPVPRIGNDKAALAAAGHEPIFAPDHA